MPLLLHMQRICSKTRLVPGAGRSRSNYSAGSEFLLQRPAEIPSEQGIFLDL